MGLNTPFFRIWFFQTLVPDKSVDPVALLRLGSRGIFCYYFVKLVVKMYVFSLPVQPFSIVSWREIPEKLPPTKHFGTFAAATIKYY